MPRPAGKGGAERTATADPAPAVPRSSRRPLAVPAPAAAEPARDQPRSAMQTFPGLGMAAIQKACAAASEDADARHDYAPPHRSRHARPGRTHAELPLVMVAEPAYEPADTLPPQRGRDTPSVTLTLDDVETTAALSPIANGRRRRARWAVYGGVVLALLGLALCLAQ